MAIEDQFSASATSANWRELYRTAISETAPQKLQLRIAEAEKAIILRGRELFAISGVTSEEAEAQRPSRRAESIRITGAGPATTVHSDVPTTPTNSD